MISTPWKIKLIVKDIFALLESNDVVYSIT